MLQQQDNTLEVCIEQCAGWAAAKVSTHSLSTPQLRYGRLRHIQTLGLWARLLLWTAKLLLLGCVSVQLLCCAGCCQRMIHDADRLQCRCTV